jgi:hypothetical protein
MRRVLEDCGHDVLIANPRRVGLISKNDSKDDRTDAEVLARVRRVDPKLLAPLDRREKQAQLDIALLRARDALVRTRTLLINHLRGAAKPVRGWLPACSAEASERGRSRTSRRNGALRSPSMLAPLGKDTDLGRCGLGLAVLPPRLWITGEVYEPLRNATEEAKAAEQPERSGEAWRSGSSIGRRATSLMQSHVPGGRRSLRRAIPAGLARSRRPWVGP